MTIAHLGTPSEHLAGGNDYWQQTSNEAGTTVIFIRCFPDCCSRQQTFQSVPVESMRNITSSERSGSGGRAPPAGAVAGQGGNELVGRVPGGALHIVTVPLQPQHAAGRRRIPYHAGVLDAAAHQRGAVGRPRHILHVVRVCPAPRVPTDQLCAEVAPPQMQVRPAHHVAPRMVEQELG